MLLIQRSCQFNDSINETHNILLEQEHDEFV